MEQGLPRQASPSCGIQDKPPAPTTPDYFSDFSNFPRIISRISANRVPSALKINIKKISLHRRARPSHHDRHAAGFGKQRQHHRDGGRTGDDALSSAHTTPPYVLLGTDGEKRGRDRLPRGPRHARPAHRGEGGHTGRHEEPMDVYAREAPHRGRPLLAGKLRHPGAHRPGG